MKNYYNYYILLSYTNKEVLDYIKDNFGFEITVDKLANYEMHIIRNEYLEILRKYKENKEENLKKLANYIVNKILSKEIIQINKVFLEEKIVKVNILPLNYKDIIKNMIKEQFHVFNIVDIEFIKNKLFLYINPIKIDYEKLINNKEKIKKILKEQQCILIDDIEIIIKHDENVYDAIENELIKLNFFPLDTFDDII